MALGLKPEGSVPTGRIEAEVWNQNQGELEQEGGGRLRITQVEKGEMVWRNSRLGTDACPQPLVRVTQVY